MSLFPQIIIVLYNILYVSFDIIVLLLLVDVVVVAI